MPLFPLVQHLLPRDEHNVSSHLLTGNGEFKGEFNLPIRNAAIIGGSERPAYKGSIGNTGDKIVAVSPATGDIMEVMIVRSLLLPRVDEHQA